jgi:hypothetical protein
MGCLGLGFRAEGCFRVHSCLCALLPLCRPRNHPPPCTQRRPALVAGGDACSLAACVRRARERHARLTAAPLAAPHLARRARGRPLARTAPLGPCTLRPSRACPTSPPTRQSCGSTSCRRPSATSPSRSSTTPRPRDATRWVRSARVCTRTWPALFPSIGASGGGCRPAVEELNQQEPFHPPLPPQMEPDNVQGYETDSGYNTGFYKCPAGTNYQTGCLTDYKEWRDFNLFLAAEARRIPPSAALPLLKPRTRAGAPAGPTLAIRAAITAAPPSPTPGGCTTFPPLPLANRSRTRAACRWP